MDALMRDARLGTVDKRQNFKFFVARTATSHTQSQSLWM